MSITKTFNQPAPHAMQPFTRPIRFVPNDGQPHAKRRRITAACQTCRQRKTRCTGEKPVCGTCLQNGHSCKGYSDHTVAASSSQTRTTSRNKTSGFEAATESSATSPESSAKNTPKESARHGEIGSSTTFQPASHAREGQKRSVSSQSHKQRQSSLEHQSGDSEYPWDTHLSISDSGGGSRGVDPSSPAIGYQSPSTTRRVAPPRMPYFRYFGPTAIVPGYKKMVVEVKETSKQHRHSTGHSQSGNLPVGMSPNQTAVLDSGSPPQSHPKAESTSAIPDLSQVMETPFYDQNDKSSPNHSLIGHLVDTFFMHLGCNFPFFRREVFTCDVEEKRVDSILVDAVCALAARFSDDPLLCALSPTANGNHNSSRSEYGAAFSNRAKSQIVDTFTCPSLTGVQVCILLAYNEFGSGRDSGLWMFLGLAIRMAQDLGLHKLEGMAGDARGQRRRPRRKRVGSRSARSGSTGESLSSWHGEDHEDEESDYDEEGNEEEIIEARTRTDTFWVVYFLDRVIASGTGRPVTLRDKEIEIPFPPLESPDPTIALYPPPFPALIQVLRLYGRVTDLLNSIKDMHTVTAETLRKLSGMEADLTGIYQKLSPKLHFNAPNFQHYGKTGQSSAFILLHIWFHTLIILLHRPTILITSSGDGGAIQHQLFPNSRELSMSSAKTIADILAFAELLDSKVVHCTPFISQSIYIAACAFLQENAAYAHTTAATVSSPASMTINPAARLVQSLQSSPFATPSLGTAHVSDMGSRSRPPASSLNKTQIAGSSGGGGSGSRVLPHHADNPARSSESTGGGGGGGGGDGIVTKMSAASKHALLATQNFQRCYKALKSMELYWDGVKYILVVMDQKAKGIVDPLLYTVDQQDIMDPENRVQVKMHKWSTPGDVWDRLKAGNSGLNKEKRTEGVISVMGRRKGIVGGDGGGAAAAVGSLQQTEDLHDRVHTIQSHHEHDQPLLHLGGEASAPAYSDHSHAIGWSLTGITNSPNSNLTFLYQADPHQPQQQHHHHHHQPYAESSSFTTPSPHYHSPLQPINHGNIPLGPTIATNHHTPTRTTTPAASDAEMLLGLSNPLISSSSSPPLHRRNPHQQRTKTVSLTPHGHHHPPPAHAQTHPRNVIQTYNPAIQHRYHDHDQGHDHDHHNPIYNHHHHHHQASMSNIFPANTHQGAGEVGGGYGVMMESEQVDMTSLGVDMIGPWLGGYIPGLQLEGMHAHTQGGFEELHTGEGLYSHVHGRDEDEDEEERRGGRR